MHREMSFKANGSPIRAWTLAVMLCFAGQGMIGCDKSEPTEPVDPDAQLAILEPTGGETYHVGDSLTVRWKAQGKGLEEINAVNIELSPDSGKIWVDLKGKSISIQDPSWGAFRWKIPTRITRLGTEYALAGRAGLLLRIKQYQTADKNQIAVTRKTITIVSP